MVKVRRQVEPANARLPYTQHKLVFLVQPILYGHGKRGFLLSLRTSATFFVRRKCLKLSFMKKSELGDLTCSVAGALATIGDAWSFLIVKEIMLRNCRFDGIAAQTGMSESSLASRLKSLEDAGIIRKFTYQERPVRYEYRVTERGADVWPVLVALAGWGDRWLGRTTPPLAYECVACGENARPHLACSHCGTDLDPKSVKPVQSRGMRKDREMRGK